MLGSLSSLPFSTGNILALYLLIVLLGVFAALLFRRRFLAH
jgi:hypothetical protein